MAHKNLLAIVTMMILVGSTGSAQSEPTLEDLLTIDRLIEDGNWRALYTFVDTNPRLTEGNSPLAAELQTFKDDVERGQLNTFNAPSAAPAAAATPGLNDSIGIY